MISQDWNPVVFKKVKDSMNTTKKTKKEGEIKKLNVGDKLRKIDNTEIDTIKKVKLSVARAISKRRIELKLSQKDLAQKINEKPEIISQYETGKAIPKQHILNKIERHLGIYLSGNKLGEEKTFKKKK